MNGTLTLRRVRASTAPTARTAPRQDVREVLDAKPGTQFQVDASDKTVRRFVNTLRTLARRKGRRAHAVRENNGNMLRVWVDPAR